MNLLRLYSFTGSPDYREKIEKHFSFLSAPIQSTPLGYAVALMALDYRLGPAKEITVTGNPQAPATKEIRDFLFKTFLPNKVMIFEKKEAPTTIRICENQTCQLPTANVNEAKKVITQ
ncbi:MAG: hypothetical protein Q7T11_00015 [Deltaproteobacteria bacterium]|nr:hypothetical protein [Deltaproteobacteria bacterium]